MSISFSSADGGLFAANPLRTDRISIKGVNWFGAEGENAAPDGLWERSAAEYLDFAVEHGFNALRLPLAVNHVLSDPPVDRWFTREWAPADEHGAYPSPPLRSLEVVERVVASAKARRAAVGVVRRGGAGRPRVSNVGRHRDPRLTGGEVA